MSGPPAIQAGPRWVLIGWLVVVLALIVWFFADVSGSDGWTDLVAAAGLVFSGMAVAGLAFTWAVVRYLLSGTVLRTAVSLLGPPALFVAGLLLLRVV